MSYENPRLTKYKLAHFYHNIIPQGTLRRPHCLSLHTLTWDPFFKVELLGIVHELILQVRQITWVILA